jgi:probable F420-dependent oxidoreductase
MDESAAASGVQAAGTAAVAPVGRVVAARLGRVGVWAPQLQWQPIEGARRAVARLETLGFRAVWIGEATGKEVMTHATLLLAASERIVVATGIASIWARDPMAMANAGRTLEEAFPGRFVMGLGVSHPFLTEPRARTYERAFTAMRDYLDAMDRAPYAGPPADRPPRVLAALGPRMLRLSADRAAGAHPYFVPLEHTFSARATLGPEPVLAPEQAVVLAKGAEGEQIARRYTSTYLGLANYRANLVRLGWAEEDLADGGSDRLLDAVVARGSVEAAAARVQGHLDAGADHVAVRVLTEDPRRIPFWELEDLAATLLPAS